MHAGLTADRAVCLYQIHDRLRICDGPVCEQVNVRFPGLILLGVYVIENDIKGCEDFSASVVGLKTRNLFRGYFQCSVAVND